MKRPNQLSILFLLLGIIATLFIIARTDILTPIMQFILATDQGTPLQLAGCVLGAAAGFRIIYILLDMVGNYYSRQLDAIQEEKTAQIQK
jgi:vancomycin permeability regulator SanA